MFERPEKVGGTRVQIFRFSKLLEGKSTPEQIVSFTE
jgi:hypothetical protein